MKISNQTDLKKPGGEVRRTKKFSLNPSGLRTAAIFLCFSVLGFFIYSNTFNSPFVFDDIKTIKKNANIRITELDFKNLLKAASNKKGSLSGRPVGLITFAINYYFHQYEPKGYHIVNIIIHILTGIILYAFMKTTLSLPSVQLKGNQAYAAAFFAALIWLVHPLQTQSVTYIMQRLNSLSAMFYILSFWLYLKGRLVEEKQENWLWFAGSALAWTLALGCKQIVVTLPFFVFLYEWYFFQDCRAEWLKRNLKYFSLLLFLIGLVALLYTGLNPVEKMASIGDYRLKEFTFLQRVLTQPRVVIYYVSLIFFPHPSRLNLDHDFPLSSSLIDPVTTLLSLGTITGLLGLAVYLAKRERLISFCILWFFGNLVIESSIIPLAVIFEHRNYLPSMMVCLIPVLLIHRYLKIAWLRIGIVCVVIFILAFWTYQRNRVWESSLTLWTDVVKKSPDKERAHTNLGVALANLGKLDEAIEHYKKALQLKPNYPVIYNNLGDALAKQGKTEEAIKHYKKALKIFPDFVEGYTNLGIALKKQGKTDEAIAQYRKALQIDPDSVDAHYNLGSALADLGKTNEAIEHYRKALQIGPPYGKVYNNLGAALADLGKTNEAIEHYKKALQIKPDLVKAHNNLGVVLVKKGKTNEAIEYYNKALQLNPEDTEALFNLGDALAKQGKTEQAITYLNKALQINPDYAEAHSNLGSMYIKQGDIEKAIYHNNEALRLNPQLMEAHNNLGIALMQESKIEAAISHFKKALQIEPSFKLAANNLERALAIREALASEIAQLQELLKDNPGSAELHFQLGNLYFRSGNRSQAIHQYEKTLQIEPNYVPALNNLALVNAANKEYDKALAVFLDVLNHRPDDAQTHYNIACMYSRLNRVDESIAWLKKAIDKGYTNWQSIKKDSDLENIRESPAYEELVEGH